MLTQPVGFGVVGLGVSPVVPMAWGKAAKVSPASAGLAVSTVATCGYLGFLLALPIIGGIASTFGLRLSLTSILLFTAMIYALAGSVRERVPA